MPIANIMHSNIVSVKIDTNIKRVAQLFFKYKFEAIPVVDESDRIQGIVTLHDTLDSVFPEAKQAAEG
jgi:magnesium transporter